MLTDELRAEAERLIRLRPWGTSVWDRLARGEQFDGMESWLPFLDVEARVCPTCWDRRRRSSWSSRGGSATAGAQLLDEEAALAETLAATWGARDSDEDPFPRLHVPFERLLSESRAGLVALPTVPEGPSTAALAVGRFEQVAGDPSRLAGGCGTAWCRRATRSPSAQPRRRGRGGCPPSWPKRACTLRS